MGETFRLQGSGKQKIKKGLQQLPMPNIFSQNENHSV